MSKSLIVEITGRRTCYFVSFAIAYVILITDRQKWQKIWLWIFLKANTKTSVWWKFQVLWPIQLKATALWLFVLFWKFARKSVLLLKFCQMREILKPQRVILVEIKVSQVGCFQNMGCWICYFVFFDISFIVFSRNFCQMVYEETILFQLKFQKSISRHSILQKINV